MDPTPPGSQRITASAVLYAGTRQGDLHKSIDGGATWSPADSRDAPWTSLAVSPLRPTVVFAAGADGLLRSTDRRRPLGDGLRRHLAPQARLA